MRDNLLWLVFSVMIRPCRWIYWGQCRFLEAFLALEVKTLAKRANHASVGFTFEQRYGRIILVYLLRLLWTFFSTQILSWYKIDSLRLRYWLDFLRTNWASLPRYKGLLKGTNEVQYYANVVATYKRVPEFSRHTHWYVQFRARFEYICEKFLESFTDSCL